MSTESPTFYPLSVEQGCLLFRSIFLSAARFNASPLYSLEIKRPRDALVKEQVLHDKEVGFALGMARFDVLDFDGVESQQLGQNRCFVRCRINVAEVRWGEFNENLSEGDNELFSNGLEKRKNRTNQRHSRR